MVLMLPASMLRPRSATLTGRARELCGRALWPGLVLLLFFSCPLAALSSLDTLTGRVPELCSRI